MDTKRNTSDKTHSGHGRVLLHPNNKKIWEYSQLLTAILKPIRTNEDIKHIRLNYQSVHIQHPMDLV